MQLAEAEVAELVLDEVAVAIVLDKPETELCAAVLKADEDDVSVVLVITVEEEVGTSGGYRNSLVNHAGGLYTGGPDGP